MFLRFFYELKQAGIPVSVKEYLTFLEAVDSGVADKKIDNFYYLSRVSLVKDERHLDNGMPQRHQCARRRRAVALGQRDGEEGARRHHTG